MKWKEIILIIFRWNGEKVQKIMSSPLKKNVDKHMFRFGWHVHCPLHRLFIVVLGRSILVFSKYLILFCATAEHQQLLNFSLFFSSRKNSTFESKYPKKKILSELMLIMAEQSDFDTLLTASPHSIDLTTATTPWKPHEVTHTDNNSEAWGRS